VEYLWVAGGLGSGAATGALGRSAGYLESPKVAWELVGILQARCKAGAERLQVRAYWWVDVSLVGWLHQAPALLPQ